MMYKTADLFDDYADQLTLCRQAFRGFGKKTTFHGPIQTVEVFEDNVLVREALETIPEGSVLIVDGKASHNCAYVGDRLAAIAVERKLAGIIVNGLIRDSGEISNMDIGVYSLGTCPVKSKKGGKGMTNQPVYFGGIEWSPGHYVYADEDGIAVSETALHEKTGEV